MPSDSSPDSSILGPLCPLQANELYTRYLDGRRWEIICPFEFMGVAVPAGFVTDFASIPRVFWRLLPPTGRYGKAAVIHDYLYSTGAAKKYSDDCFLDGMKALGVNWLVRRVMYRAVRWFGRPVPAS